MSDATGNREMLKKRTENKARMMEIERLFLTRDPDQDRMDFDPAKIDELSSSMRQRLRDGKLPNAELLWVEQLPTGEYRIISGESRDRAAEAIGYEGPMNCLVYTELTDDERSDLMALANNGRNDLNLWEKARAVCRRIDRGQKRKHVMELYNLNKSVLSRLETFYRDCDEDVKGIARSRIRNDINFLLDLQALEPEKRSEAIQALQEGSFDSASFKKDVNVAKESKTSPTARKRKPTKLSINAADIRFLIGESSQLRKAMKEYFPGNNGYKKAFDGDLVAAFGEVMNTVVQSPLEED